MKTIVSLSLLVFALLLPACDKAGTGTEGSPPTEEAFTHPPVGVIKAADYAVTLHTGPDGPLYTIVNEEGERVALEITRQQLAAEFPELNEELQGLWAGNEAGTIPDRLAPHR